jgi:hypothetical protein
VVSTMRRGLKPRSGLSRDRPGQKSVTTMLATNPTAILGMIVLVVAVARAWDDRRRRARQPFAGPGDDKPPGYENPSTYGLAAH